MKSPSQISILVRQKAGNLSAETMCIWYGLVD